MIKAMLGTDMIHHDDHVLDGEKMGDWTQQVGVALWVWTYTIVYMHICIYRYTDMRIYIYIYIYIHVYVYIRICIHTVAHVGRRVGLVSKVFLLLEHDDPSTTQLPGHLATIINFFTHLHCIR
jgi:hypothetical protein